MKSLFSFLFFILVCFPTEVYSQKVLCVPGNLRCEYLINPLGIDVPSPRLSWKINDVRHGAAQQAYRIIVGTDSTSVARGKGANWDSDKVDSNEMLVTYSGSNLNPFTRYYWSVQVWDKDGILSNPAMASFETGMMEMKNWKGSWISDGQNIDDKETPYFRKEFEVSGKIKAARAYIAVGGLYELYVNGQKIGNHRLDPMFTRYDQRNLYVTYDITNQLKTGRNAVGVLLGNGWYNHQVWTTWDFINAPWRNRPAFCMDMRIVYENGKEETIVTDLNWKSTNSPVTFNSIYTGEHYDARLEQPGWNSPAFNDSNWSRVSLRAAPSNNIVSQQLHPIRNVAKILPVSINKINDTIYVFDLGINISGVSELIIKGEAGTKIKLKHGELLYPNGRVDISNMDEYQKTDDNYPMQTDIFILGGKGEERFMPRFNYKGFQYVEVTSSNPLQLTTNNLIGYFMHSDVPPIGKIKTSNPTINKIWWATNNSYLANLFGYPTDCPQREKCGWTGDAQVTIETGLYNFDGITVYEKWLADHRDEQKPNGLLPSIIPTSGWGYWGSNGVDWTSSIAIIPWNIYLFYGDTRLLSDCYDNIKRYVDYISETYPSGLADWGLGDHNPVTAKPPVELTSSVYYYTVASILSKAAKLFGKEDDYTQYRTLAEKIKDAINLKYLDENSGKYGNGGQTELSVPLYWGVVPDELKAKVALSLARRVEADNNHIDVGLLGSKAILNALSDNGFADLAYTLASQETYPSWGHWIAKGSSTLFEQWSAEIHNSKNHIMFGEISAWFFKGLGGIKPDPEQPGFKNIILQPLFVKGLTHTESSFVSPYGEIISSWNKKDNSITYFVSIPANSTADLYLPREYYLQNARIVSTGKNIVLRNNPNGAYQLQAGNYELVLINK